MKLKNFSIKQIHEHLKKRDFSAEELVQSYLENINEEIGAFLSISDTAIPRAKEIDEQISRGEFPLMAGIPMGIKDAIMVKGEPCTAGSKILENYTASYNATCIQRLKKQGAVFLGKTNMDEFAMGSSNENSAFKKVRNPHDLERVPGGSSGGSAAAVADNECCCALGSDTGGSVRLPASFCGVVGLKPTYGSVSRYGLIAFASSLDQIGPIAKTVDDSQIIFDIIKGRDTRDSTSVELKDIRPLNIKKLKIGVPKEYFSQGIDNKVKEKIEHVIKEMEKNGAKIEEINLPYTKYALACYYIIAPSEASANLARYDGVRYGKAVDGRDLMDSYLKTRGQGFGSEVKRRIMLGTYALSSGYYDAYYIKAQKVRSLIRKDFEKAFEKIDVMFTPTAPSLPFKIGEKIDDPLQMYMADILTISINLAGNTAISIPCAKIGDLPVGLQIIGKHFHEADLFETGRLVEKII